VAVADAAPAAGDVVVVAAADGIAETKGNDDDLRLS
jgi:hypothetical protein